MAYSKTTPGQVAAQLAAGAAVFGLLYRSFYGNKEPEPTLEGEQQPSLVAALDAEARNTAGKHWAAQQQADSDASSTAAGGGKS